jgi:hypothetical protein
VASCKPGATRRNPLKRERNPLASRLRQFPAEQ